MTMAVGFDRAALVWRAPGQPPAWGQDFTIASLDQLPPLLDGVSELRGAS